jgi:hypothetical protein
MLQLRSWGAAGAAWSRGSRPASPAGGGAMAGPRLSVRRLNGHRATMPGRGSAPKRRPGQPGRSAAAPRRRPQPAPATRQPGSGARTCSGAQARRVLKPRRSEDDSSSCAAGAGRMPLPPRPSPPLPPEVRALIAHHPRRQRRRHICAPGARRPARLRYASRQRAARAALPDRSPETRTGLRYHRRMLRDRALPQVAAGTLTVLITQ